MNKDGSFKDVEINGRILSGKAYLVTASASAIKNLVMLPVQTALLCLLLAYLLPYLRQLGLVPETTTARLRL